MQKINKKVLIEKKKLEAENLRLNHLLSSLGHFDKCSDKYRQSHRPADWKNAQHARNRDGTITVNEYKQNEYLTNPKM